MLSDCDGDNLNLDDSLWGDSDDDKVNKSSDLDREWQRRRDQFHTVFNNLESMNPFSLF